MSGNLTHVLFENASGYALFEVTMQEEIVSSSSSRERRKCQKLMSAGLGGGF